jgi:hypothetical protein
LVKAATLHGRYDDFLNELGEKLGPIAYSRVHSGVHYPADALVGSMIGIAIGHIAARVGGSRSDA